MRATMSLLLLAPTSCSFAFRASLPRERSAVTKRDRGHQAFAVLNLEPQSSESEENLPRRRRVSPPMVPTPEPSSDDGHVFGADSLQAVVAAMRNGSFALLAEDGNDETSVSLVASAQHATPEQMEFLQEHAIRHRLAMSEDKYSKVYSSMRKITLDNNDLSHPALSVSIDGAQRDPTNSTHVAQTLRALTGDALEMQGLRSPGAIPLVCAAKGGILRRAGATEAAVELARLAGLEPEMTVLAELRGGSLQKMLALAEEWGLPYTTTADVVAHARRREVLIERCGPPAQMPTKHGRFTAHCFRSLVDGIEHIALVKCKDAVGDEERPFASGGARPALVRVHSECCTGDIFGSLRCDCGPQLELALQAIERDGHGVVLYLRGQEGRGIGLGAKMHAYVLQERGVDTLDANLQIGAPVDSREYGTGAQILASLGISDMRLMSNNPKKFSGLAGFGLRIVERVPSMTAPSPENIRYMRTKMDRMGHMYTEEMLQFEGDGREAKEEAE